MPSHEFHNARVCQKECRDLPCQMLSKDLEIPLWHVLIFECRRDFVTQIDRRKARRAIFPKAILIIT